MTGKGGMQELAPVAGEGGEQELAPVTDERGRQQPVPMSAEGSRQAQASGTEERNLQEHLWRWLGISVGGTLAPFGILALSYYVNQGHMPVWGSVLGNGDLFIPASIMNVEAIWIWARCTGWERKFGFPVVAISCGIAALAGACTFGITTAAQQVSAQQASVHQVSAQGHQVSAHQRSVVTTVTPTEQRVTTISLVVFLTAFVVGTSGGLFKCATNAEGSRRRRFL